MAQHRYQKRFEKINSGRIANMIMRNTRRTNPNQRIQPRDILCRLIDWSLNTSYRTSTEQGRADKRVRPGCKKSTSSSYCVGSAFNMGSRQMYPVTKIRDPIKPKKKLGRRRKRLSERD
ncbi:hypothetical protein RRG08_035729 [Elysia crispata]|uniref:Uncharacterized protein n=1 Tax=Elysia crispata TaxID=231223 RepID=A0AAE0YIH4_9GAST|nr:hypothetical protein RRG08_035729 [Elysia crispata]